jgi:hypothetical protein
VATPREIVVENDISGPGGEAEKEGWLCYKMQFVGRRGCPDRWHFRRREVVIIEYKKRGERPDGLQRKTHDRLRGQGFEVHVCDNHDDARRALKLGIYGQG